MTKKILEVQNLYKNFGPTKALKNIKINIYEGKAMALLGENGAGKSTLIKCISGVLKPNAGIIKMFGKAQKFSKVNDATKAGIAVVHQELQLCNNLTVYENIYLGRNITKFGIVNHKKMQRESQTYLDILNVNLSPKEVVANLTIAQQQMVEIAKALSLGAKILILDEPTDALSEKESNSLFEIIANLKKQGIGILYVTHRMEEINKVCEYYTIFKDGEYVKEGKVKDTKISSIIEGMIGRKLEKQFPKKANANKTQFIKIKNFSNKYVSNISLDINRGEILGLAGLVGSGRTEFAKTIIGELKRNNGYILQNNKKMKIKDIKHSIKRGIYYVTEDRKKDGLSLNARIDDNIVISNLKRVSNKMNFVDYKKQKQEIEILKKRLNIKFHKQSDKISSLSGGNQQKVLLSKAIFTSPSLLILDEPTRGVDVGARKEIYKIIVDYAKKDNAVIIISSDLPEIIGVSERVGVFNDGRLMGLLSKKDISEKKIINLAINRKRN